MRDLVRQLQDQHQDLMRQAHAVEEGLRAGAWRVDPKPLISQVGAFIQSLAAHLDLEDGRFYPEACQHPTQADLARRYQSDLGHLREIAAGYLEGWTKASSVLANPKGFEDHTAAFLRFLHRRIRVEEEELYPAMQGKERLGLP